MRPRLSVLIVAWNNQAELAHSLPAVSRELDEGDELIVFDNASRDDTAAVVAELAPQARLIRGERNLGFAGGCNEAATRARGDLLVILNPDATPRAGFGAAIRRPWEEGRGWAAWQGLVAAGDGTTINSAGNPIHFTGIVWAGGHGQPLADAPAAATEVASLSGACLAIPRRGWEEVGGFPSEFFLYHEDVDLSLRLRLRGGVLGIEPAAVVDHDYEFDGNSQKWRWLERNRWSFLIRSYPGPLLALVAPALLLTELALLPAALAGGWGRQKLGADADVLRGLPRLLRQRRRIQAERVVDAAAFATWLTPDLDSPFIPAPARSALARALLRAYWRLVRRALR